MLVPAFNRRDQDPLAVGRLGHLPGCFDRHREAGRAPHAVLRSAGSANRKLYGADGPYRALNDRVLRGLQAAGDHRDPVSDGMAERTPRRPIGVPGSGSHLGAETNVDRTQSEAVRAAASRSEGHSRPSRRGAPFAVFGWLTRRTRGTVAVGSIRWSRWRGVGRCAWVSDVCVHGSAGVGGLASSVVVDASARGWLTIATPVITTAMPMVAAGPGRLPWAASMRTATTGTRNVQA